MNFSVNIPLSDLSEKHILETNLPPDYIFQSLSTDSRIALSNANFICLKSKESDAHNLIKEIVNQQKIQCIITHDPSYIVFLKQKKVYFLYVTDTTTFLQECAKIHRKNLNPFVIAITGSNGKTTTKDLLSHLLTAFWPSKAIIKTKKNFNNYFGVAYSLLNIQKKHKIAVIELGTNHPGEIAELASIALPDIGVLTSISESHIGHFYDIYDIIKEKCSMSFYLAKNNCFIISENIKYKKEIEQCLSPIYIQKLVTSYHFYIYFIQQKGLSKNGQIITYNHQDYEIPIWGKTQFYNIYLSLQVIHEVLNIKKKILVKKETYWISKTLKKLSSFQQPDNRMSLYACSSHWIWNDTYNANLASFYSSINILLEYKNSLNPTKNWSGIFGAMEELGKYTCKHHQELARYISLKNIQLLVFIYTHKEQVNGIKKGLDPSIQLLVLKNNENDINKKIHFFFENNIKEQQHILMKGSRTTQIERFLKTIG